MERRSLLDGDDTRIEDMTNVFDDEFEVEDFDGVADGFRPGHNHDREGGGGSQGSNLLPTRSVSEHYASGSITPRGPSRNSTRKSRSRENPFTSPEDEAEQPLHRTPSGNFATYAHRSVSSASSNQYAGTNSPRFGTGGPSHPYGMYPQGTVARTPSMATTSTVRPGRQSTVRGGPQHPYTLYPQGVGDDAEDEHHIAQNQVPIGFMGLGQSYQRRRGPDGEEQDFLGDYGHTEQLPPYTRYPEDGPEKMPLMGVPDPPSALHSRAPVLGSDPGMALMHDHIQTAAQSMTDETNLNRQASTMSRSSAPLVDGGDSLDDSEGEKSWREKSWREKRRTRICGIPFLWILLAAGFIALIAVIVGAVFGGYAEGQRSQKNKQSGTNTLYDASLIATPTSSPPTGSFAISLGAPEETQAECLTVPGQVPAWDCNLGLNADIAIDISTPQGAEQAGARLYSWFTDTDTLYYGLQTSSFNTSFSTFLLVKDNDDPENGDAFYFQAFYNKVVVVPGDQLPGGVLKRDAYDVPGAWFDSKQVATSADKPWMCYWNGTSLEGFIYPKQPAVAPSMTSSASLSLETGITTTSSKPSTTTTGATWPSYLPSMTGPPDATVTSTLTLPSTTCTYTGVASGIPAWIMDKYPDQFNETMEDSGPDYRKRDDTDDDDDDDGDDYDQGDLVYPGQLPPYPYLIKLEERRLPGSPAPYCVQYQVLDTGDWNWIPNAQGGQIVIQLTEEDPAYKGAGKSKDRRSLEKRTVAPGACHCQWMIGA